MKKKHRTNPSISYKQATRIYAMKNKPGGLSDEKESDAIFNDTSIWISKCPILWYVTNGQASSPKRK